MKLPTQFETWFEFASHAIQHFPQAEKITLEMNGIKSEAYKMDFIKSMAFGEIIADLNFSRNDVSKFKNVAMCTGYFTDDESSKKLENMTDLLWKLSR